MMEEPNDIFFQDLDFGGIQELTFNDGYYISYIKKCLLMMSILCYKTARWLVKGIV